MKRHAIVAAVLSVFLASLLATSIAEARAGGSFSGGSRGSRTYSAPRSPAAPAQPSSPASPTTPQRSLTPGSSPAGSGGFLRGWGGMIGGFLLGGLLGSLLFGGLGSGAGFGLLDLVLVAGLAYFAFALLRRRTPEPALAGVPSRAGWAPEPSLPAAATTVMPFDTDLDSGMAAIRTMDPAFDPARLAGVAHDIFVRLQTAWTAGDLTPVRDHLTDEMAAALGRDLDRLRTLRRTNRLEQVVVNDASATEAWQEYGRDFVTVRLRATALDYTVDDATGAVLEGSKTTPTTFEEYWTFTRPVGPNPWRLSAIQQPTA
jgi:predicted lipid-binding transport protein (Tim44 family)